jgi:glutamate decarboxylase
MPLHKKAAPEHLAEEIAINPMVAGPGAPDSVPRHRIGEHSMPPEQAYQVVHDELLLDGNARLNLATFVTTWMEPQAERLMAECLDKNIIDKDEYPQTAELERRCVNILADLWNSPEADVAVGCSTTGSSEACMLGGMALTRRWRARRRAAGLPADRPNLVMGANVQVCWEKFARYWEVEPRLVPLAPGRYHLTPEEAVRYCDENTVGVVAILGSTYDGSYEPVAEIAAALDRLAASGGPDVPIHVDAASGGFVAPFLDPDLVWDFRLRRVASINASGHKYGLVYPGVGWALWRTKEALPRDLVFTVDYLGGEMPTFALNFSRPGAEVIAQYYNLVRLGREGYRRVQQAARDTARWLAEQISKIGPYELISDGSQLPVFAFRMTDVEHGFSVFDVSDLLRQRGWQVPAYTFPEKLTDLATLRIVIRNGFSGDLARLLLNDLTDVTHRLADPRVALPAPDESRTSFHH